MRSLLWIVWAVLAVALGWYTTASKAPAIEQDVLARSAEAIKSANPNAEVSIDGRFVNVRGPEPTEEARAKTMAVADGVWGALPRDGLWVPAVAKAFEFFSADKGADGKLTLTGSVPTDAAKAAVEAAAKESFKGEVVNDLSVSGAGGELTLAGIGDALKSLSSLDAGSLLALPGRFRLAGKTADQAVADTVAALGSGDPAKWGVFVQGPVAAPAVVAPSVEATSYFSAVKTPNGNIVASGAVATEAAHSSIIDTLRGLAGGATVVDRMSVQAGLPDGWGDRISSGLKALGGLDFGSLSLEGAKSYLNGSAAAGKVEQLVAGLGSGWDADVTAVAPVTSADPSADLQMELAKLQAAAKDAADNAAAEAAAAAAKAEADMKAANERIAALTAALAAVKPGAGSSAPDQAKACNETMINVMSGKTIEFATASATITQNGLTLIDAVAAEAKPCLSAGLIVTVAGHTDDQGEDAANLDLSEKRAAAVKAALVARGLPDADIKAVGYGETRPVAPNDTEEGRAQNRRISFDWFVR